MRAVGLHFDTRTLGEASLPEPVPAHGEALFRVLEVGVCGTDRELARFRFGVPPPGEAFLTLGHEALGEVIEPAGALKKGDLVVPFNRRPCRPACISCGRGRRDLCVSGGYTERGISGVHGYFTAFAADDPVDLFAVPAEAADVAILLEPLSVVEKAIEAGLKSHPYQPMTAAVQGAGPIGILTALALLNRGLHVTMHSLEAPDDPRIAALRRAGIEYGGDGKADLVFEATGSPVAAAAAFARLAPLGVLVFIGAISFQHTFPGERMVVENLTVTGVVNSARQHYQQALDDLMRFDRRLIGGLISRRGPDDYRESILGVPNVPKIVHRLTS